MSSKAEACLFLGYTDSAQIYKVWSIERQKEFQSHVFKFIEDSFPPFIKKLGLPVPIMDRTQRPVVEQAPANVPRQAVPSELSPQSVGDVRSACPEIPIARSTEVGKVGVRVEPPSGVTIPTAEQRQDDADAEGERVSPSGTGTSLTEVPAEQASGTETSTAVPMSSSIDLHAAGHDITIDSVPGATVGDVQAAVPNEPDNSMMLHRRQARAEKVLPTPVPTSRPVRAKRRPRWREVANAAYTQSELDYGDKQSAVAFAFALAYQLCLTVGDPQSYRDAVEHLHWREAMSEEWQAHRTNETFTYVTQLPQDMRAISCRWVFKTKVSADGHTRYKARLVIRGFEQQYGLDYTETFAPVAKMSTIRVLLAMAAYNGWAVHQMDVVTAFLNPVLSEDVYMELPPGFEQLDGNSDSDKRFIKLNKALYGLKQAPREWYAEIDGYLISQGFVRSGNDTNLYVRNGYVLIIYVDDVLITGPSQSGIDEIKALLHQRYKMVDFGVAKQFLGIQIEQSEDGIRIFQTQYISTILERFGLANAKSTSTPMVPNSALSADDEDLLNKDEKSVYMSIVGSLMYAMVCTRPDLAYTLSRLSKFMANPATRHMTAARHALRYLCGTQNACIHYARGTAATERAHVDAYSDSDFAADVDTRRSTSGYVFTYNGSAICWKSKQQDMVTLSTMEAEYVGLTEACREMIWLQSLMADLHGTNTYVFETLYGDNQSSIAFAENARHHTRNKHIALRYHFIRDLISPIDKSPPIIRLQYKATGDMTADVLTKALTKELHQRHTVNMGMETSS